MTSSERARRTAEIVKSAMEREPQDCAAFLDQACAGDHETRAEVDSLLKFEINAFLKEMLSYSNPILNLPRNNSHPTTMMEVLHAAT